MTSLKFVIILFTSSYLQNILTFSLLILLYKFSLIWSEYMFQLCILLTVFLTFDSFMCYTTFMCRLQCKAFFCFSPFPNLYSRLLLVVLCRLFSTPQPPSRTRHQLPADFIYFFSSGRLESGPHSEHYACPNLHPVGDSSYSPLPNTT